MSRIVIWQIFTRIFGSSLKCARIPNGTISQNGCGKLNSYTNDVIKYYKKQGATHLWFTGLLAHASKTDYTGYGIPASHNSTVKGQAGSPYAVRDYYDIDPDLAESVPDRNKELKALIRRVHSNGLGFIMDFVPNHVAREYHSINSPKGIAGLGENDNNKVAFSAMNNFYYIPSQQLGGSHNWMDYTENPAKATGNDRFSAAPNENDWYETVKLNYGVDYSNGARVFDPRPDTWNKMTDILLFWAGNGIDGFRCDMAEMVPVDFWHYAIGKVKEKYPDILFIAEIYNPGSYQSYIDWGGFDYIYDKAGMYDALRAITTGHETTASITRCWQQYGKSATRMLHFMENHDEQRIASSFFAGDATKGRPGMIVSACMDNCPIMIYAGQEIGEPGMDNEGFSGLDGRSTIFDYWIPESMERLYNQGKIDGSLLSDNEKELQDFYARLLSICKNEEAISKGRFYDLMYANPASEMFDANHQFVFLRSYKDELLLIAVNFNDRPVSDRIVIPQHAFDYMQFSKMDNCIFTNLLSDSQFRWNLYPDSPIRLNIPANNGVILKIRKN